MDMPTRSPISTMAWTCDGSIERGRPSVTLVDNINGALRRIPIWPLYVLGFAPAGDLPLVGVAEPARRRPGQGAGARVWAHCAAAADRSAGGDAASRTDADQLPALSPLHRAYGVLLRANASCRLAGARPATRLATGGRGSDQAALHHRRHGGGAATHPVGADVPTMLRCVGWARYSGSGSTGWRIRRPRSPRSILFGW